MDIPMTFFKRITATFGASVEGFVSRVENHDAIIQQGIKECRQAVAKTRVQLKRIHQDGENLQQQIKTTQTNIKQWQTRAIDAIENEEKALSCMQRKRQCEQKLKQLESSQTQQHKLEDQVRNNLTLLEHRLEDITRQRNSMRSRQATAEAMRVVHRIENSGSLDLDDVFERWEINVSDNEILSETHLEVDNFEAIYIRDETHQSLLDELNQLKEKSED